MEVHDWDDVRSVGQAPPLWYAEEAGLFGDEPYVCLRENRWFDDVGAAASRYFVIEARSGQVREYRNTLKAYREETYLELFAAAGFEKIERFASLDGTDEEPRGLRVLVATRP